MRLETLRRMGCEDPKGVVAASSSHVPQEAESVEWRAKLRESEFLANPLVDNIMTSVSGKLLDKQLPKFTESGWSRRRIIYEELFKNGSSENMPDPVFVVPEERVAFHDIKNQTKVAIANKIKDLISQLTDEEVKFDYLKCGLVLRRKRKKSTLFFMKKLERKLRLQISRQQ
ncbi:hypothetical protein HOLleu_01953 [Holothuria leucospilota]|uniref:Uncharacterized protein n=1 Tax=Holothuria leucospilota TaxID=206669 RepID=A0A9Q1HL64_HOLLE|nr:hypothetical protein HOLleu_01953 [Holothuria leucospilota]